MLARARKKTAQQLCHKLPASTPPTTNSFQPEICHSLFSAFVTLLLSFEVIGRPMLSYAADALSRASPFAARSDPVDA